MLDGSLFGAALLASESRSLPTPDTTLLSSVLTWAILVYWALMMFGANFLALALINNRYANPPPPRCTTLVPPAELPGISILRPLKGIEGNDPEHMLEHLASCMTQRYPKYEVVFSVADKNDPAVPIIQKLMRHYPSTDARIILGAEACGANPKVCNLARPYRTAKHPVAWVLDSNVHFASPDALARAVDHFLTTESTTRPRLTVTPATPNSLDGPANHLANGHIGRHYTSTPPSLSPMVLSPYDHPPVPGRVGLVHHVPVPTHANARSWGSLLESVWLSTAHAKMYTLINWMGIGSCVCGKSHMYWREDLATETDGRGIEEFGGNLAEDNQAAKRIWDKGVGHAISPDLALQPVGALTLRAYLDRRVRWARVRKYTEPAATLLEPLTECLPLGALVAWCVASLAGRDAAWAFFAVHVVAWFSCDWLVYHSFRNAGRGGMSRWIGSELRAAFNPSLSPPSPSGMPISLPTFAMAWLAREVCALPLYAVAVSGSVVDWRGRLYRVEWGGTAVEVEVRGGEMRRKRKYPGEAVGEWLADKLGLSTANLEDVPVQAHGQGQNQGKDDGEKPRPRRVSSSPVIRNRAR